MNRSESLQQKRNRVQDHLLDQWNRLKKMNQRECAKQVKQKLDRLISKWKKNPVQEETVPIKTN